MRKLILLLTIAALICLTLPAMADGDGITFNSQNVRITFDQDGGAAVVERSYVPWQ